MREEPLPDADFAYLRFVEFGELPARVRPEDYVELVETGPAGAGRQRGAEPGDPAGRCRTADQSGREWAIGWCGS